MVNEIEEIKAVVAQVMDPEVPVLSVTDLGIVRKIEFENGTAVVTITPTYSGCPAMDMIAVNLKAALVHAGFNTEIKTLLSPAWTTDWMTEEGKKKLKGFGIAPPTARQQVCRNDLFSPNEAIACPRCNSLRTRPVSMFGSTACKALYQCLDCHEPFDYFKCH